MMIKRVVDSVSQWRGREDIPLTPIEETLDSTTVLRVRTRVVQFCLILTRVEPIRVETRQRVTHAALKPAGRVKKANLRFDRANGLLLLHLLRPGSARRDAT